jgi:hypothetical protein
MADINKGEITVEEILYKKFKELEDLSYSYKGLDLIMENIESAIENPRTETLNIFTIGKKKPYILPLKEKKRFFKQLDSLLMVRKAFRYKYKNLHILLDNVEAISEVSEENKLRIYMRCSGKTYIIPLKEKESFLACMGVCLKGKKHLLENIEYRFVTQKR